MEEERNWCEEEPKKRKLEWKKQLLKMKQTLATVIGSPSTALERRRVAIGSLIHGYRTTSGLMKGILGFWLRTIMLM